MPKVKKEKKVVYFLIIVAVLMILNQSPKKEAIEYGDNIVPNYGFENWSGTEIDKWDVVGDNPVSREDTIVHSGSHSLKVEVDGSEPIDWTVVRSERFDVKRADTVDVGAWVYVESFTMFGNVLQMGVDFYNAANTRVLPYNFVRTDVPSQVWEHYTDTIEVPPNAVWAEVVIWMPPDVRYVAYFDDLELSYNPYDCTPAWSEICGNYVDDDCDAFTDEGCDVMGIMDNWTQQDYIDRYDGINQRIKGTTAYTEQQTNGTKVWSWNGVTMMQSNLRMYTLTGDSKYIGYNVDNLHRLIGYADDYSGNGLKDWDLILYGIEEFTLPYSRLSNMFVMTAYYIKKYGLSQYYTDADDFVDFVETNFIPMFDGRWQECVHMGFWSGADGGTKPYPINATSPHWSAVNNQIVDGARTHLYLYLITGDEKYYTQTVRYANKVKSTLLEENDGRNGLTYYRWNYANKAGCKTVNGQYQCDYDCKAEEDMYWRCDHNPSDRHGRHMCQGETELRYAAYDIMFMLDAYEAGIVFDSTDIEYLANSFKETYVFPMYVNGFLTQVADANSLLLERKPDSYWVYKHTPQTNNWAQLGQYDTESKQIIKEMLAFILADNIRHNNDKTFPYECMQDPDYTYGEGCAVPDGWITTPAYTMSMISHYLSEPITLTPLTDCASCPDYECSDTSCVNGKCHYTFLPDGTDCSEGKCLSGACNAEMKCVESDCDYLDVDFCNKTTHVRQRGRCDPSVGCLVDTYRNNCTSRTPNQCVGNMVVYFQLFCDPAYEPRPACSARGEWVDNCEVQGRICEENEAGDNASCVAIDCDTNGDCPESAPYCNGTRLAKKEGICVDYNCQYSDIETDIEDCAYVGDSYCNGTAIYHEEGECNINQCETVLVEEQDCVDDDGKTCYNAGCVVKSCDNHGDCNQSSNFCVGDEVAYYEGLCNERFECGLSPSYTISKDCDFHNQTCVNGACISEKVNGGGGGGGGTFGMLGLVLLVLVLFVLRGGGK